MTITNFWINSKELSPIHTLSLTGKKFIHYPFRHFYILKSGKLNLLALG